MLPSPLEPLLPLKDASLLETPLALPVPVEAPSTLAEPLPERPLDEALAPDADSGLFEAVLPPLTPEPVVVPPAGEFPPRLAFPVGVEPPVQASAPTVRIAVTMQRVPAGPRPSNRINFAPPLRSLNGIASRVLRPEHCPPRAVRDAWPEAIAP